MRGLWKSVEEWVVIRFYKKYRSDVFWTTDVLGIILSFNMIALGGRQKNDMQ